MMGGRPRLRRAVMAGVLVGFTLFLVLAGPGSSHSPATGYRLPNMNTYIDPMLRAVLVNTERVSRAGQWSIPGVGRIVSRVRAIRVAESASAGDGQGPFTAGAVRLVLAHSRVPLYGHNPLWLVTLHGFGSQWSTNPDSNYRTGIVIVNASTGVVLSTEFVERNPNPAEFPGP